jgi:phage terminase Nu1 subunit (DNA packaging protein)
MKNWKGEADEFDLMVPMTQARFGRLVGVTQSAVSEMLSRGILPPEATGHAWLLAYCGNLREVAAGRMSEDGDSDLVAARTRLANEQADAQAMKNAVTRQELAPVILIEQVLSTAGSKVAGILDTVPATVKRRLPHLTANEVEIVAREIAKARNIAAAIGLQDLGPLPGLTPQEEEQAEGT